MPYNFYGGLHLNLPKTDTADKSIRESLIPKRVVMPLLQHVGSAAEPLVKPGDTVKAGDVIGRATGFISSPVHSSINGKVTKISYSATTTLSRVLSIFIESEEDYQKPNIVKRKEIETLSKEELLGIIRDSGIVGLGGATFPTHVKLSPPKGKVVDTVILNGAECEPYLTCDYRLMVECPGEISKGLEIIAKILGVNKAYIAIEDDKPLAIEAMEKAVKASAAHSPQLRAKIVAFKTKYPQGAEKQVIKAVLNRIVPAGGLPMDVGCVVQNVGTAFAVYEAVCLGKPLIERVITVAGPCVKEPMNIRVRIGTVLSDLVDFLGGIKKEPRKLIIGGPMMGVAQYTTEIPITKGTNGILLFSKDEIGQEEEGVCIRCARCLNVCPMQLAPTTLMYRVKKGLFQEAKELGIASCFECGACAYACSAKIPLLDYMKLGKSKI